jgi:hypothetical protein
VAKEADVTTGEAVGGILPLAIAVDISVLSIIAVILMLITPRARSNDPALVAGWVLGLAVVGGLVLIFANTADVASSNGPGTPAACRRLRQASRVLRVHARGQHHETAGAGPGRIMVSPSLGAGVPVGVTGAEAPFARTRNSRSLPAGTRGGPADRPAAGVMIDHPGPGRHRHQHERTSELDDQPDLQRPRPQGVFLEPDQVPAPQRGGVFGVRIGGDLCNGAASMFSRTQPSWIAATRLRHLRRLGQPAGTMGPGPFQATAFRMGWADLDGQSSG